VQQWNAELLLKEGASLRDIQGPPHLLDLPSNASSIPNGGISNFSSILLTAFGYSSPQALILNTPSGAIRVFLVLLTGWLSDKWRDRSM